MNVQRLIAVLIITALASNIARAGQVKEKTAKWPPHIQVVLDNTKPLEFDRGDRLPLYLWNAMNPGPLDDKSAEDLVTELNERGVGLISSWDPRNRRQSLTKAFTIAKAQKMLGLRVNINATGCLYSFFNGDERTAHIDDNGKPFWDNSFGKKNMGCPFTLDFRIPLVREQTEFFVKEYKEAGLDIDFIFVDWEIDGPIEFNKAHAASKRCRRCLRNINKIDDFDEFQKVLRKLRCQLQRRAYAEPVKLYFPYALIGNYGVYPHNGFRYWYDYFEYYVYGQPYKADQNARYRKWYREFPETGYTFAMPVVYTWRRIFDWYDYTDTDYRWFYNLLLVASNAGEHTFAEILIISFVHWHTIESKSSAGKAKQFSEDKYQELLWHMLLRGTDTFFLWCGRQEAPKEIRLVHQVYAQAQQYGQFLSRGVPINFNVPKRPGTVISGLKLENRVLVRRTDFKENDSPVEITVGDVKIKVAAAPGLCQIISLR
ncbi:MAG: hypothetical protein ACYS32_01490 [Planctomycetota bacterium]|jgi:hypothetical protein